ncbi:MAG: 50S ribosomal protein L21, partial [Bdellovibrionales bacterium]|nr:50S ribosomal protein L21 [Bdellovibrionales bacterium]
MYAIIRTGGKQYRVEPGEYLRVEKFNGDLGAELDLTDVLVVGGDKTFFGEPTLANAKVTVVVTKQQKAPKVTVFKKKRRQGYRRMHGHRQFFTEIFIKSITSP